MGRKVKIRGIYSTALTKLLMGQGYSIVEPSPEIRERLGLGPAPGPADLVIQDRSDLQGIHLVGGADGVSELLCVLRGTLLDSALVDLQSLEEEGMVRATLEFPGATKAILDDIRSQVVPTLARHHRLRIIDPVALEKAERELARHPQRRASLERGLFEDVIIVPSHKASPFSLEHVSAKGKAVRPRSGILVGGHGQRLVVRRGLSKGRYDGLDLPIEEGDYAMSELEEGAWFLRHSYYSRDGRLKGEYYNINSPLEIYPQRARYLDLEVDVVCRAGEAPLLVDEERLLLLVKDGLVGSALAKKAMEVAADLMKSLARS